MKHESFVDGITKILVEHKAIKPEEGRNLRKAFEKSPKPNFDEFLIDEGLVDKDDLLLAIGEYYQIPWFDAVGYFFNHALLRQFSKDFLLSNAIIPIERDQNMLIVLASNPNNSNLLPLIGEHVSYDIRFRSGLRQDIINAIQEYYDDSPSEVDFEPTYDEDLQENMKMRQKERQQGKDIEEIAYEDQELEKK